jgi:hypothetical protein
MPTWLQEFLIGLAIVVVALVLEYRTKFFARALESMRGKQDSVGEYMEHPTPSEIAFELDKLPDLFDVDLAKYPEFSILRGDRKLQVKGEISGIKKEPNNMWGVTLSNCVVRTE